MEVTFHFIENILRCTTEDDGAGSRGLALNEVGEVVITDFADVEKAALSTHIRLLELLGPVDNLSTRNTSNTNIISLSDTTNDGNGLVLVSFEEEVLSEVGDTLLSDDDVGLPLQNVVAHMGNFLLFLLESLAHGRFGFELHVSLTLSLLVLERAVEEDDTRIADSPAHAGMGDILVDHHSFQNLTLFEGAPGDLFHTSITLDFEVELVLGALTHDGLGSLDSKIGDELAPTTGKLGADAALKGQHNFFVLVDIDWLGDAVQNTLGKLKSLVVG